MTRRNLLLECAMTTVAGKKLLICTLSCRQRWDGAFLLTIECSTGQRLDPSARVNPIHRSWHKALPKESRSIKWHIEPLSNRQQRRRENVSIAPCSASISKTPSSRRSTSIGAGIPLPTPSFLSLCQRVGRLAQTHMLLLRSYPSDE